MSIIFQTEHSFSERLYLSKFQVNSNQISIAQPGQYAKLKTKVCDSGPYSLILDKDHPQFLWICSRKKLFFSFQEEIDFDQIKGQMIANDEKKYIFCAAGTGVAPFLSLLKSKNKDFKCFWMLSDPRDLLLLDYFDLKKHFFLFNYDKEMIDMKNLLIQYICHEDTVFYLAGSYNFVTRLGQWLLSLGVIPERIVSDMKKFS
jgi:NAD(P)H-flavin reductase